MNDVAICMHARHEKIQYQSCVIFGIIWKNNMYCKKCHDFLTYLALNMSINLPLLIIVYVCTYSVRNYTYVVTWLVCSYVCM